MVSSVSPTVKPLWVSEAEWRWETVHGTTQSTSGLDCGEESCKKYLRAMVVGVGEGLATDKLTLCFRGVVKPPGD